jgi:hypothetical protein
VRLTQQLQKLKSGTILTRRLFVRPG